VESLSQSPAIAFGGSKCHFNMYTNSQGNPSKRTGDIPHRVNRSIEDIPFIS
jgi:hypothetical protein